MLGFIVAPYGQISPSPPSEVGYTIDGHGDYLCPPDPQYNMNGEPGLYYDTPLGGLSVPASEVPLSAALVSALQSLTPRQRAALTRRMAALNTAIARSGPLRGIPTDAELATVYGYTPFASGWVSTNQGYVTSNLVPPNAWDPSGKYGPPIALSGPNLSAADVTIPASATPSETQALVDTLNAQSNRSFKLAIITTVVIGVAAAINSYRTWKQLKRDEDLLKRSMSR